MKNTLCFALLLMFGIVVNAQGELSKFDLSGNVSAMPYYSWQTFEDSTSTFWEGNVQNRLNLYWYASENFTFSVQFRNQLMGGEITEMLERPSGFETESYFLPLTYYQKIGSNYLMSLSADRLWGQYTNNNLEITLGRQRINWGQTFAWNPNDIFNSYNFFEFDYEERPGADAFRVQYYTGMTSSVDFAIKVDSAQKVTAASLYRLNKWNYDFQIMLGYYSSNKKYFNDLVTEEDLVFGLGWSGDLKGPSFRGELSYFVPISDYRNSRNQLVASLALDYTFKNETYLFFEAFYNDIEGFNIGSFEEFYAAPRSPKTLSITKYNFVGQVSYPVSPIFNVMFAGMYFFQDTFDGLYLGPTLTLSASDNIQLSSILQVFAFKDEVFSKNKWATSNLVFLRFKWSF